MNLKKVLKQIQGPSLKDQVESGDLAGIRRVFILSWIMFILAGLVIGIELCRKGFVPI
jgi:hypothetical protein